MKGAVGVGEKDDAERTGRQRAKVARDPGVVRLTRGQDDVRILLAVSPESRVDVDSEVLGLPSEVARNLQLNGLFDDKTGSDNSCAVKDTCHSSSPGAPALIAGHSTEASPFRTPSSRGQLTSHLTCVSCPPKRQHDQGFGLDGRPGRGGGQGAGCGRRWRSSSPGMTGAAGTTTSIPRCSRSGPMEPSSGTAAACRA